jgi:hypothetical protein
LLRDRCAASRFSLTASLLQRPSPCPMQRWPALAAMLASACSATSASHRSCEMQLHPELKSLVRVELEMHRRPRWEVATSPSEAASAAAASSAPLVMGIAGRVCEYCRQWLQDRAGRAGAVASGDEGSGAETAARVHEAVVAGVAAAVVEPREAEPNALEGFGASAAASGDAAPVGGGSGGGSAAAAACGAGAGRAGSSSSAP